MIVTVVDPRPTLNVTVTGESTVNVAPALAAPVVLVTAAGPQGPAGPVAKGGHTHLQSTPSTTWTIQHNLGYGVAPTVVDTNGEVVFGWTPSWSNLNVLILTFPVALAGSVHVS